MWKQSGFLEDVRQKKFGIDRKSDCGHASGTASCRRELWRHKTSIREHYAGRVDQTSESRESRSGRF